ncbi:hypothetical protein G4B88_001443 [Cannabis sativa]|uniref:Uncharacterized protein n=1 Tax=Cannabis sativa TaxID=3483 RepID=A0A7J6FAE8_CANSA|nr:hypothetical protein G4B88_001443 [Cannabis sativa]
MYLANQDNRCVKLLPHFLNLRMESPEMRPAELFFQMHLLAKESKRWTRLFFGALSNSTEMGAICDNI